jgi:S1-C subfamily serine protease
VNGKPVPLPLGVAKLSSDRPRDGSSIAVSGYPFGQPVLITTNGTIASAWSVDIKNAIPPGAPAGFTMPDIRDSYLADISVNPGNSGGPVYRAKDGSIIGVCVAFRPAPVVTESGPVTTSSGEKLNYNSGLSIIVPIRYGEELLARHATDA